MRNLLILKSRKWSRFHPWLPTQLVMTRNFSYHATFQCRPTPTHIFTRSTISSSQQTTPPPISQNAFRQHRSGHKNTHASTIYRRLSFSRRKNSHYYTDENAVLYYFHHRRATSGFSWESYCASYAYYRQRYLLYLLILSNSIFIIYWFFCQALSGVLSHQVQVPVSTKLLSFETQILPPMEGKVSYKQFWTSLQPSHQHW